MVWSKCILSKAVSNTAAWSGAPVRRCRRPAVIYRASKIQSEGGWAGWLGHAMNFPSEDEGLRPVCAQMKSDLLKLSFESKLTYVNEIIYVTRFDKTSERLNVDKV